MVELKFEREITALLVIDPYNDPRRQRGGYIQALSEQW
jgi:hypothetical protein